MTGIIHFEAFLLAGILLNLTPGNDTIFILAKSIGQGRKAGIVSALGIGTGSIVHTIFAACGLSFIIARSILLFNIIKYAGALYLLYMGVKMFTGKSQLNAGTLPVNNLQNHVSIYRAAVITNMLNPKVALFFIAFLPQFIDPHFKQAVLPFLLLGITFVATGTVWCLVLAVFAARISGKLSSNRKIAAYINKFCGAVLIALGLKVAFIDEK